MRRLIITNNEKVKDKYCKKAEVQMLDNASSLQVLQSGKEVALQGGRLLQDPSRNRCTYYKSLVFYLEGEENKPDEKSLFMLEKCINAAEKSSMDASSDKKPLLAWMFQNKDLESVKKILV